MAYWCEPPPASYVDFEMLLFGDIDVDGGEVPRAKHDPESR